MDIRIETSRLLLRPIEESDAHAIFEYAHNPNVAKWVTWEPHQTLEDSKKFIQMVFQNEAYEVMTFAVCLKDNPKIMLGDVSAFWKSKKDKTMELGAVLNESYWGQGYITEALSAVIDYCFKNLDVLRIQSRCKKGNSQSRRMMEKIGMEYEGLMRSSLFCKNQSWDMEMFSIIKKTP